jgi:hypothetical protein
VPDTFPGKIVWNLDYEFRVYGLEGSRFEGALTEVICGLVQEQQARGEKQRLCQV